MKNLKKVLALALSATMALSMFVSAGAAFTDQGDIKTSEAVDTLVALGVLKGYEDGSFKPDATVTRAEMAKMIYVLRTGKDDATAYASSTSSFTDINGHWAAGYIKYCQSLGIIAGKSATQFAPEQTVTGEEAAKMLLVTLGYNAEKVGLVGTNWAKTTIALADENSLLDDVDAPMSMALPRQFAAQLMFNAVDAPTVKLTDGEYSNMNILGKYYPTIGEKYMGLKKTVGIVDDVTKEDGKSTYTLSIDADSVDKDKSSDNYYVNFTKVAKDYSSMKYKSVKVLYKDKDNVYGVYATTDNTTASNVLGNLKMDGDKVKLDGTKYSIADNSKVRVDGAYATPSDIAAWVTANAEGKAYTSANNLDKGAKAELIANNGTSKVSLLNITTYTVQKVTYVGSDYITAGSKRDADDYNYPSDIKKDDYVVISDAKNYADGKGLITKADIVEGKITSSKTNSDDKVNKVMIDSTWYSTSVATTGDSALKNGANVKLILVNGYIYKTDKITAASSDIALLVAAGKSEGISNKYEARLIFADGSDKTVSIEKYWEDDAAKHPTPITLAIDGSPKLVSYEVSKDVYTLTEVTKDEKSGYDEYVEFNNATVDGSVTGTLANSSTSVSKLYFESTGIVFVREKAGNSNEDPDFKVVKGSVASKWDLNSTLDRTLTVKASADTSGNNLYAQVSVVDFKAGKSGGSSDKSYAVALDASYTSKEGSTTYTNVKGWNGSEEVLYKIEGNKSIKAGAIFEFSANSDDTYDVDVMSNDVAKVKSFEKGTGDISLVDKNGSDLDIPALFNGTKSKIDSKDTLVLFVNSDKNEGANGSWDDIREANKYNDSEDKDVVNVAYFAEDNEDQITVLVVDVNNNYTQW